MSTSHRDIYRGGKLVGSEYTTRRGDGSVCKTRYRADYSFLGGRQIYGKGRHTCFGPKRKG